MRIWCKFCGTLTDGVVVTPMLRDCLRANIPKTFVVYCRKCEREYLLKRKTHELVGTVSEALPMNPMEPHKQVVFVADGGELIVGQEEGLKQCQ